jgi:hypothetical protein
MVNYWKKSDFRSGSERTFSEVCAMSALPPKADIDQHELNGISGLLFTHERNRQIDSRPNGALAQAVAFEPSLRPLSPENGNIFENDRRLSAI